MNQLIDQDEHVRAEPKNFVDRLDPKEYINWEVDMDHYFEWCDMPEEKRLRFAKMRLIGQAKMYWTSVERMTIYQKQEPISGGGTRVRSRLQGSIWITV